MARAWPRTPEVQSASHVPPRVLGSSSCELSTGAQVVNVQAPWAALLLRQKGGRRQYPAAACGCGPASWCGLASAYAWPHGTKECSGVPRSP